MAARALFVCVLLMLAGTGACSSSKDAEADDESPARHEGAKEAASAEAKEGGDDGDSGDDDDEDEEEEAPAEEGEKPVKEAAGAGAARGPDAATAVDMSERLQKAQEALRKAESAIEEVQSHIDGGEGSEGSEARTELTPERSGIDFQLVKELAIPIVAFIVGAVLHKSESTAVFGKLAMFFGAQTIMNLYMKEVLSGAVVDEEAGLHGIPCAFIVTALQQIVAFILFVLVMLVLQLTPYAYTPKKLTSPMEWLAVVLFSFSFTMNIALNNFSISLLPLSVNLIIRSCLPLATYISQMAASRCTNEPVKDASLVEIALMLLGVACAAVAVVAKSHGGGGGGESKTLVFGIIVCVASLFSGAINLALAGVLGTSCKLNSLDTTVYMSMPAFLFLVVPSLCYWHPVSWPGYDRLTDWDILTIVLERRPFVVGLAAFSGVLALFYNVFQYGIVHSLSASYTAFAGNFNKAATIALGLLVGLEHLPPGMWGIIMALACLGNIGAFTAFNIVKIQAKNKEAQQQQEQSRDLARDETKELLTGKA